jgi:hypothetical protein
VLQARKRENTAAKDIASAAGSLPLTHWKEYRAKGLFFSFRYVFYNEDEGLLGFCTVRLDN